MRALPSIVALLALVGCLPELPVEDTSADTDTDTDTDPDTDTDTDTSPAADADEDGFDADTDCDDTDPEVHPGAEEVCDGYDNDCDGDADTGAVDAGTWYLDADADGFGDDSSAVVECDAPGADYVDIGGDCDDSNAAVHPGAEEADCEDPVDYNCDGSVGLDDSDFDGAVACEDCDDADATSYPDAPELEDGADNDCDAVVDEGTNAYDDDLDGFTENAGDCDDANAGASPDGVESCDGADNDCDAVVDDGTSCFDDDADGVTEDDGDCDDASDVTYPGAAEVVDGADNDCNGLVDDGTDAYDDDGDAYTEDEGDCDDANADASPLGVESCDGYDNDCDGDTDEADAVDASTWWEDPDADGYGDVGASMVACDQPAGYVLDSTDCSGGLSWINPGEVEVCDDYDNDCDGVTDEADAVDAPTWWIDGDADGYGDVGSWLVQCDQPSGYVLDSTDCSGGLSWINPGEAEVCDGYDNDCDGTIDGSDAVDASTWWMDGDNDGYGDTEGSIVACDQPSGYVLDNTDCSGGLDWINPGEDEVCDGYDNDCDGTVDEADAVDASTWYADGDGDGYGDALLGPSCTAPSSSSGVGGDCDDTDVAVSPGMAETCDAANVDEDCDGLADDLDPEGATGTTDWWPDADGDSWGVPFGGTSLCDQPAGYGPNVADCDDSDATISPDAAEVWYDGVDQDCDYASGRADYDSDGDGFVDTLSLADADGTIEGSGNTGNEVHYIGDTNGDGYDDIYVAAPSTYNGSIANAGMGYLFQGPITGDLLVTDADATFQGLTDAELHGTGGAFIGDVDGDGVDDVMVAAVNYDGGYTDNGGAFFFPGGVTGAQTSATAYTTIMGPPTDDAHLGVVAAGRALSGAGIVDAAPEVLIGVPDGDARAADAGDVYMFASEDIAAGGTLTISPVQFWSRWSGEQFGDGAGSRLCTLDFDGSGGAGYLVTASPGRGLGGRVYVQAIDHGVLGQLGDADGYLNGSAISDLGSEVACLGDVNLDGYEDFAVAGGVASDGRGVAYVVLGQSLATGFADTSVGTASAATFTGGSNARPEAFGNRISVGDWDGDGDADLAFGVYEEIDDTATGTGTALLWLEPGTGSHDAATDATITIVGDAGSHLGSGLALDGDVDGDGYDDLLVGGDYDGPSDEGGVWIYRGSAF